jgi:hypothetical protein
MEGAAGGAITTAREKFPLLPAEFVATIVTDELPEAVGVPLINPVVEFMLNPSGKPLAL